MNRIPLALAIVALGAGSAALAQTGARSLIDAKRTWTAGGSEQTTRTIKDPAVPGGKAVEMTSTGKNSKYSANVSYRLIGAFQKGETITLSGLAKAAQPTRIDLFVELADAPFSRIGGGSIDVGTDWKPYTVTFVAPADRAAGITRAIVQLNSEARTVSFGPLAVTATPAR